MWTKTITYQELKKHSRWKVDFFSTSSNKLTSRYEMVKLGSLVEERKENCKPFEQPEGLFNFVGLENVTPVTGELVNFSNKFGKEIKSSVKVFHTKDILYGRLRPYLNKIYLAADELEEGICSGEFLVLIPDYSKVMPYYLRGVLSSDYIQNYVQSMQTGSALPRISKKDLFEIEIPLPPMEIQRELDSYIQSETSKIKKLRRELYSLPSIMISNINKTLKEEELL